MQFGFPEIFLVIINSLICCVIYDVGALVLNHLLKVEIATTFSRLIKLDETAAAMYSAVELLVLSVIGVFSGFIASFIETKRLVNRFANLLHISRHDGDIDVWTVFCSNPGLEWLYVRDYKHNFTYFGRLIKYSDPGETRELLLADVNVYDEAGNFCYNSPVVYISRQDDDFSLELPQNPQTKERKNET